ncbi:MAG: DUF5679 domain-containing protein [Candidatus Thalassarchaeaceae archaeon]
MAEVDTGFCMKCKQSTRILNPTFSTMKNGRKRISGDCSSAKCGGRISKIVS